MAEQDVSNINKPTLQEYKNIRLVMEDVAAKIRELHRENDTLRTAGTSAVHIAAAANDRRMLDKCLHYSKLLAVYESLEWVVNDRTYIGGLGLDIDFWNL